MQVQHKHVVVCALFAAISGYDAIKFPAACPDGNCPGLGHAFFLPEPNAISMGGSAFARRSKVGECATVRTSESATRTMKVVNSMQELVHTTNNDYSLTSSLSIAILTVKGSVDVLTSKSSDLKSDFHSAHLDVTFITKEVSWDRSSECFSDEADFDDGFLNSFKSLAAIDPEKVAESGSWAPYVSFLKYRGSHVMSEQSIGSRFQHWESSTSSSSDVAKKLQVKACAEVEGLLLGGWSVESCANYSESEKRSALRTESYTKRVILGGTTATRIALLERFGNDTLNDFINSAPHGNQPVSYGFIPIWEPLIDFYNRKCSSYGADSDDCRHLQRAYNLQAAYEGWLAVGCPKRETTDGVVYQSMTITDPSAKIQTYQCHATKTGCYSDNDCHIGGAGAVCYCYGESCIDSGETVAGTQVKRDVVRGIESGHYYSGVNNACYYHVGVYCKCDHNWSGGLGSRQLWVQDESPALFRISAPFAPPLAVLV